MIEARVHTLPMASPSDTGAVSALFDEGQVEPQDVVALIAQTEGDGFARGYAALSLQLMFGRYLGATRSEVAERIPMLMIGGTAGLMSPHVTLFVRRPSKTKGNAGVRRLALGVTSTRVLKPEEYGRTQQIELVAKAVRDAMKQAGIRSTNDVTCVELKCPQMTPERAAQAGARGKTVADPNTTVASAMSRGASAIGTALALSEVSEGDISDAIVGRRADIYSNRASASSGIEQDAVRVVVIGNVDGAPGNYVAASGIMEHPLDLPGARKPFMELGLRFDEGIIVPADRSKVSATFVNAGADYLPHCLGRRHTMGTDLLAHASGHVAKAVAHASVAGILQDTLFLCSAGAEHQGKPGSNLVSVIANLGVEALP